jgi:adenylate cyclase, class 1
LSDRWIGIRMTTSAQKEKSRVTTIEAGLKAFDANCQARITMLRAYTTANFQDVFNAIPVFLQVNRPNVPGYIDDNDTPAGIHGFEASLFADFVPQIIMGATPQSLRKERPSGAAIESLLLIGSAGTMGQTMYSDLDYWVCYDPDKMTSGQLQLLTRKLTLIEEWSSVSHDVEVNFYRIDLKELARNRFKQRRSEFEGEVAPLLLKEELYRTLLFLAGKRPLWWSLPSGISPEKYKAVRSELDTPGDSLAEAFIDLGFPEKPAPQEYLAAALWLSTKSMVDPFKGTIKLLLILQQVETDFQAPFTCELFKKSVFSAEVHDLPIDPYELTVRRVLGFADMHLPEEWLDLIRLSVHFKIRGPFDVSSGLNPRKLKFLEDLYEEWRWDETRVRHLNDYLSWSDQERIDLGHNMNKLLFVLYSMIAKRLMKDYPDRITETDGNLAQFKARILARYSRHQDKVEDLPFRMHKKMVPKVMTLVTTVRLLVE